MVSVSQLVFLVALCGASVSAVTKQQDYKFGEACAGLINKTEEFIPAFVRLIFHDCVGGCDGCINLKLKESKHGDTVNAGLDDAKKALDGAYSKLKGMGISKADFYAKCAQVAAETGRRRSAVRNRRQRGSTSKASDMPIKMRYGRKDCNGKPREKSASFPDPRMGITGTLKWCKDVFNFTRRECVAIMGAHSIGRAHPEASGYRFVWIPGGQYHLDNRYYSEMISRDWEQSNVARGRRNTGSTARYQYSADSGLMLNTDICLLKNIKPNKYGEVTQKLSALGNSTTANVVYEFAADNNKWLNAFGKAFTKLMGTGNQLKDVVGGAAEIPPTSYGSQPAPPSGGRGPGGRGGPGGRDGPGGRGTGPGGFGK